MFEPRGPSAGESHDWLDRLGLDERIRIPGLNPAFPRVACHRDDVCLVTTGAGQANAATSLMTILASRRFDLRRTYFLVAGIAGIDPADGTLGSAAWARWAVSGDLADEIDAREIPPNWPTGYFGLGAVPPGVKPTDRVGTEVYHLNESLVQRAYALTRNITLTDSADAQAYRAQYPPGPATEPPTVNMCDTISDDTYWEGRLLSDRAGAWVALMTDGQGNYCTTQQETTPRSPRSVEARMPTGSISAASRCCGRPPISTSPIPARRRTRRCPRPTPASRSPSRTPTASDQHTRSTSSPTGATGSTACQAPGHDAASAWRARHAETRESDDLALHLVHPAAERADGRLAVRLLELTVERGTGGVSL